jgi:hypothetical protein
MYLHPKTGALGAPNITDEFKKSIYDKVVKCIKSGDYYDLTVVNKKLKFHHHLLTRTDETKINKLLKPIEEENSIAPPSSVTLVTKSIGSDIPAKGENT